MESVEEAMKAVVSGDGSVMGDVRKKKRLESVDRTINRFIKSQKFKERCKDFILSDDTGVESGHDKGGFRVMKEIALGIEKKAKVSDKIAVLTLMAKVAGELKENITVERVDPFADVKQEELLEMAKESLTAIEANKPSEGNHAENS